MDLINAAIATIITAAIIFASGCTVILTPLNENESLKIPALIMSCTGVLGIIAAVWMLAAAGVLDN